MSVELLNKTDNQTPTNLLLEDSEKDVLVSPQASTCTWCGTYMMWDDHCKSRKEAAHCHRYKGPKK